MFIIEGCRRIRIECTYGGRCRAVIQYIWIDRHDISSILGLEDITASVITFAVENSRI